MPGLVCSFSELTFSCFYISFACVLCVLIIDVFATGFVFEACFHFAALYFLVHPATITRFVVLPEERYDKSMILPHP